MKHGMETCWWWWKWKVKFAQSCPILCDPVDYTVHGILQARILEWVAFPFSRGSSQPRDRTQVSHITSGFFTSWATREAQSIAYTGNSRFILQNSSHNVLHFWAVHLSRIEKPLAFSGIPALFLLYLENKPRDETWERSTTPQRKLTPAEGSGCRSDGEPVSSESTRGSTAQLSGVPPGVLGPAVGLLAKGNSWGRAGQCPPPPVMSPCRPEKWPLLLTLTKAPGPPARGIFTM